MQKCYYSNMCCHFITLFNPFTTSSLDIEPLFLQISLPSFRRIRVGTERISYCSVDFSSSSTSILTKFTLFLYFGIISDSNTLSKTMQVEHHFPVKSNTFTSISRPPRF